MNKKVLLLSALMLFSCGGKGKPATSTISSETSVSEVNSQSSSTNSSESKLSSVEESVSSESISSSLETNSESESEESSSETAIANEVSILEAKEKAKAITDINSNYYGVSDELVKIEGKVLARYDLATTKVSNQYQILVADNSGYIYVNVPVNVYSYFENNLNKSYSFTGNPGMYCSQEIINYSSYEATSNEYNVDSLFENKSFEEMYARLETMNTNMKGTNISDLVTFKGKYVGAGDDKVLLFSDGEKIIQVHTESKAKNGMNIGNVYELNGALTMYYYKPGVQLISYKSTTETIEINREAAPTITAADIYKNSYEKDKGCNLFYKGYTAQYENIYHFKGYVNGYDKSGYFYFALTDENIPELSTYQNAVTKKALVIQNDDGNKLNDFGISVSPYVDAYNDCTEVEFYFSIYLLNTLHYYQIYIL